jgi:outer membrane protein TolC
MSSDSKDDRKRRLDERPRHRGVWLLPFLLVTAVTAGAGDVPASRTGTGVEPVTREAAESDRDALEKRIAAGPTLADLSAYAYLSSPMVKAARSQWRATSEKYRIDTAWSNPELMVEGMRMVGSGGMAAAATDNNGMPVAGEPAPSPSKNDWKIALTQAIPLPGKLGRAGDIAQADARIARFRLDAAVRDVVVAIRESYQELLYIRDARRIAVQNRDLLDQLRKVGEGAYAANRAALVDVMKAQAQSGQLLYDAVLLEELERTEKSRMNGLLDRPADAPIGPLADMPSVSVVYSLPEVQAFAESNLEENRIAQAGVEKSQAMQALTRYETLPEFSLGASYGTDRGDKQVGVQVGVMLPIWLGKNAGRTAAARADVETMQAMKRGQANETRTMVQEAWFRLRNAERLVTLYRDDLLPQAARAIESAETLYKQGQGAFSDYVETQATFYTFQLSLSRAKADYGKFLARIEKLAGQGLTDREGAVVPRMGKEVAR